MKKETKKESERVMLNAIIRRDEILKAIAPRHSAAEINDISRTIFKFLDNSFPNTKQGAVVLALQMTTDLLIADMMELQ